MSKSVFTLSFIVEIVDVEVWHDCEEGWIDLGPCIKGLKIQYNLYPGFVFDVDILIWPHVVKVWSGNNFGWVRTWQYLQRRWFAFTIRHAIPVKVMEFLSFKVTVTPTNGMAALGSTAKNDKNFEVYIPALQFGERRYFAPVIDSEVPLNKFIEDLIWRPILEFIPATCMDGLFDTPLPVTDVRHQDTVISFVQDTILDRKIPNLEEDELFDEIGKSVSAIDKRKKDKGKSNPSNNRKKTEISLTGEAIVAGAGRIIPFDVSGEPNSIMGEVIALISSNNLPAYDDVPILFINVNNLVNIPIAEFRKQRIVELYLRWSLGKETYDSKHLPWRSSNTVNFNYHHSLPLPVGLAAELTASFLEEQFKIEVRAILEPKLFAQNARFFGFEKTDRDFGKSISMNYQKENLDVVIGHTKIDCRQLSKGINGFIRGEYFLFPPTMVVQRLQRDLMCTNDINGIRQPIEPPIGLSSSILLESNMNVEVSIGLVGCKPRKLTDSISRLYSLVYDSELIMKILKEISNINDKIFTSEDRSSMLTGGAIDVGNEVFLFVEGPKDGKILNIWQLTEDDPSKIKTIFSSSARFSCRLYYEFLIAMPFHVLKMFAPLGVLLACPPVYTRPYIPVPARSALLKIGRIIGNDLRDMPDRSDLPTPYELRSFRLELCVPPRPTRVLRVNQLQKLLSSSNTDTANNPNQQHKAANHKSLYFDKVKKKTNK